MTTVKEGAPVSRRPTSINKILYAAFVLMSLYQLVIQKDPSDAMANLGIALIFDPFDPLVTWTSRPAYQRVWLVVHVVVVFALLGVVFWA